MSGREGGKKKPLKNPKKDGKVRRKDDKKIKTKSIFNNFLQTFN